MCNTLEEAIKNAGLETEIRNIIFHLVRSKLKPEEKPSQINIVNIQEEIIYRQETVKKRSTENRPEFSPLRQAVNGSSMSSEDRGCPVYMESRLLEKGCLQNRQIFYLQKTEYLQKLKELLKR